MIKFLLKFILVLLVTLAGGMAITVALALISFLPPVAIGLIAIIVIALLYTKFSLDNEK